ncbi:type II toxin-antitoxin system RelE/ParE family toxin [Xenorhabdus thuongxuanensis]|uniref:Phage derived protein, Gp49-like n=1 Tax=Xenorhabdus thuongxuanensis TaxID=1873484 RepID=A0A1Q5TK19_9GAMM|nr:type II toxin-antitoxin system RelE/ParE family toxin [Xenorhabdus thuongxuanensis]OKP00552.1 phage derived protein, Gp49-like [Xenorhabdus thuongxuanensis]
MIEIFFHQVADNELDNLSIKLQAKFYALIEFLSEKPHLLREPHCKQLDQKNKIFELRAGDGHNIARGTWCYGEEKNTIYILSFFIKKTQKTDPKDIQTAINRKRDMISLYQRGELA